MAVEEIANIHAAFFYCCPRKKAFYSFFTFFMNELRFAVEIYVGWPRSSG
jgi:hypothetical protein